MNISGIERRYAKALMRVCNADVAEGRKYLDVLQMIGELFKVEEARKVLVSPVMPRDLKMELLHYAVKKAGADKDKEFNSFIESVATAGRIASLPGIAFAFAEILNQKEGIVEATLTSAVDMDKKDLALVGDVLKASFGKNSKIQLSQNIDKNILGGMVIRLGNAVIDLSVKTKLDQIAKNARL